MIRVRMGINHRIQPVNPLAHRLRAKIRRRIDHHVASIVRKQQGRPGPLVARIARLAHRAMATKRGHAHRCTGSQNGELQRGHYDEVV